MMEEKFIEIQKECSGIMREHDGLSVAYYTDDPGDGRNMGMARRHYKAGAALTHCWTYVIAWLK